MSALMRAKLQVLNVISTPDNEQVTMSAVSGNDFPYDENGLGEDNTYAKFSPMADFNITIANPALFGKIQEGDKFYVDFTKADE